MDYHVNLLKKKCNTPNNLDSDLLHFKRNGEKLVRGLDGLKNNLRFKNWIRISSSWKSIGESHVEGSWPLMKSNDEKSVSRFWKTVHSKFDFKLLCN
jgi:hypothetical protein